MLVSQSRALICTINLDLYVQVRKLMLAGIDLREVTGDYISKEDYIAAQSEVSSSSKLLRHKSFI